MTKRVWLSYDLGINGDFESIYTWLADHDARECGDSLATFMFEYKSDLPGELRRQLEQSVTLRPRNRLYVIWEDERGMHGRFMAGKRKTPPWSGFGSKEIEGADEG